MSTYPVGVALREISPPPLAYQRARARTAELDNDHAQTTPGDHAPRRRVRWTCNGWRPKSQPGCRGWHAGHIGRLCDALARLDLDPAWTAGDLIDALDQHNRARGLYALPADSQRNPLALFITQARQATADREPPAIRRAAQRSEQRAAQRERDARRTIDTSRAAPPNAAYLAARKTLDSRSRRRANTPTKGQHSHAIHT